MAAYRGHWELESIFHGGSSSVGFQQFLERLNADVAGIHDTMARQNKMLLRGDISAWEDVLQRIQNTAQRTKEASSFVQCLTAKDMRDKGARALGSKVGAIQAAVNSLQGKLMGVLTELPDEQWSVVLQQVAIKPAAFALMERRSELKSTMNHEREALAAELALDGYRGWEEQYMLMVGRMKMRWNEKELSMAHANNLLSHESRSVRRGVFFELQSTWSKEAEVFCGILNHLAGFRLRLYGQRGWDDVLGEPLRQNRLSSEALDRVIGTVEKLRPHLVKYLETKAMLLGQPRLDWHDLGAPLGNSNSSWTFAAAAEVILESFEKLSPKLASKARQALTEGWVDAAERPNKRSGGFCTSFPHSGQSRICLTFSGTAANVVTLAHELGHAYHQSSMHGLPHFARRYPISIAETSSTLAEMAVSDVLVSNAANSATQLQLLDAKLRRAVTFLMTAYGRFLFEKRFYNLRKTDWVSVDQLNTMMVQAQRDAFADALNSYDPTQWASRLFFYYTAVPFYNFPYTAGYLLSAALHQQSQALGVGFARIYHEFLTQSGSMDVAALVQKHFGLDIHSDSFSQQAIEALCQDVEQFVKLANQTPCDGR